MYRAPKMYVDLEMGVWLAV